MRPVRVVRGTMVPLPHADVDTDQIIPKQFLSRTERHGYGSFLFHDWATTADGGRSPEFFTNDPRRAAAKVLVAGRNFGCGSSREHAVWALQDWGFEAVIAPSFGDIFKGNCLNVGLLTVQLPEAAVEGLARLAESPDQEVTIDLERQTVECAGLVIGFDIVPEERLRLMKGLDQIGVTLEHDHEIAAFEARRPAWLDQ